MAMQIPGSLVVLRVEEVVLLSGGHSPKVVFVARVGDEHDSATQALVFTSAIGICITGLAKALVQVALAPLSVALCDLLPPGLENGIRLACRDGEKGNDGKCRNSKHGFRSDRGCACCERDLIFLDVGPCRFPGRTASPVW
eukprot:2979269-Rhodomonas_salina.2